MEFQSMLAWKPCQRPDSVKRQLLMVIDVALLAIIGIILPRAPSAVQGVVPRLPRLVSIYALASAARAASLCAGHAQQLGGESPPANQMEVPDATLVEYPTQVVRMAGLP